MVDFDICSQNPCSWREGVKLRSRLVAVNLPDQAFQYLRTPSAAMKSFTVEFMDAGEILVREFQVHA
jgi:hypothetical protein